MGLGIVAKFLSGPADIAHTPIAIHVQHTPEIIKTLLPGVLADVAGNLFKTQITTRFLPKPGHIHNFPNKHC